MKRQTLCSGLCELVLLAILLATLPSPARAQAVYSPDWLPSGESTVCGFDYGFATQRAIYIIDSEDDYQAISWSPEYPSRIRFARWKTNRPGSLIVLLSNGDIYELLFRVEANTAGPYTSWRYTGSAIYRGDAGSTSSETFEKVVGDALYALSTSAVYVNRGNGSTWSLDTTGFNRAFVNDLALDTSQNVYAATGNGLFKQGPDASLWIHNDVLKAGALYSVFVDRRNRIFVGSTSQGVYLSTDNAATWTRDTAGMGNVQVGRWSDDKFGNVYAVSSRAYRSTGGTGPWTPIDGGILANTVNAPTIRDISGDSVLYAATSFGLFRSSDQGNTWKERNTGIRAETYTGFLKTSSGKWFTSDDLGIYTRNNADTFWTKSYPAAGFRSSQFLYADGAGNVYAVWGGLNNKAQWVFKSGDGGMTWNADTLGLTQLRYGNFFVDEAGGQHIATTQYGSSFPSLIYSKSLGGTWSLDTAGFRSSNNSYTTAIASDRHGFLYVSGSYFNGTTPVNARVMRRRIGAGQWTPDTAGLGSTSPFSVITPDKIGNMFGAAGSFLFHRSNGTWSRVPLPTTFSSPSVQTISLDSSGALFAALTNFNGDRGVYFTTNLGASWTYVGLDSVGVTQLVSYGDSTFASTINGLYILTRKSAGISGIPSTSPVPSSFQLYQNFPNPFNPTTKFEFRIANFGTVTLEVFDLLGREVTTLLHEALQPGTYTVPWDASRFASGVYFYRLNVGSFTETRKLVLLK